MTFEPRGQLPGVARRCAVMKCKVMVAAGQLGKFCDRHRRDLMEHGAAGVGPLDPTLRRLYIDAVLHRLDGTLSRKGKRITRAKPIVRSEHQTREMQSTLTDLRQRLSSLPEPMLYHRIGVLPAQEQGEQALSWIVRQLGLEKAAVRILAQAVGAEVCPKLHGGERYRRSQVARSVLSLLKSEQIPTVVKGRTVLKRFPCRGWHMKKTVAQFVEKSYLYWSGIREELLKDLKLETEARMLELHGVTARGIERYMDGKRQAQSTTVARLEEARVGTPVDPSCPSCVEYGWRFACAIHNTDEERASRWTP